MISLPSDAPRPRRCLLRKQMPEQEYGFNLHAEKSKGQFIGAVDSGSPADTAGLRPGDRIVAINGTPVVNDPHKTLVGRIKENAMFCDLLVVDEKAYAWYSHHNIAVPIDSSPIDQQRNANENVEIVVDPPSQSPSPPPPVVTSTKPPSYHESIVKIPPMPTNRPRLCVLIKPEPTAEFGFNLHAEKNNGHFIGHVDSKSIGEYAGLQSGQRIVGVNGVLVYTNTPHKEVVGLIKAHALRAELLVASLAVDAYYKNNSLEYSFDNAEWISSNDAVDGGRISKTPSDYTVSTNGESGYAAGYKGQEPMKMVKTSNRESTGAQEAPYGNSMGVNQNTTPAQSAVNVGYSHQSHQHQPEWMQLSAAELRERVGQHKKADPRMQQVSLQQKHDMIRNM